MKLKILLYEAEEGGYWAEVPALRGCVSEGETLDETLTNIIDFCKTKGILYRVRCAYLKKPRIRGVS